MFAHPDPQGGTGIDHQTAEMSQDEIDRKAAELAHAQAETPDPQPAEEKTSQEPTVTHETLQSEPDPASKAEQAPVEPPAENEPVRRILVYGAIGEEVDKLVNLLSVLGYDTNDFENSHILDKSVLVDVRAASAELGIQEPTHQINGEYVGEVTLDALYEAVGAKLEAQQN